MEKEIDEAILSATVTDWEKAISIIGEVAHSRRIRYVTVGARMQALIENGSLLWEEGDISNGASWIRALVKKPN